MLIADNSCSFGSIVRKVPVGCRCLCGFVFQLVSVAGCTIICDISLKMSVK